MQIEKCVLVIIMTNGGGEGKTTWAEILSCMAELCAWNPCTIDIDAGNFGYVNRNGDDSAIELAWDERIAEVGQGKAWISDQFKKHPIIIADTGANFMVSISKESSIFLNEIIKGALNIGARVVFHAVTSPNKAGSGDLAEKICNRYGSVTKTAIIRSNRDGSGAFKEGLDTLGIPVVDIGHLAPGLQEYRLTRRQKLDCILREPTPNFELATAMIARWLLQIEKNEHVKWIFNGATSSELSELAREAPISLYYSLQNLANVRNEKLLANAAVTRVEKHFHAADPSDRDGFYQAAIALRNAWKAYQSL